MGVSIKVEGLQKVEKYLKNVSSEVYKGANAAVKEAGFYVQTEVIQSIAGHRAESMSVDTGRFKNSIQATQDKPLTAKIYTNVEYAGALEYGTSKMRPRRHFTNTAKRTEPKVKDFIEAKIKAII